MKYIKGQPRSQMTMVAVPEAEPLSEGATSGRRIKIQSSQQQEQCI
jgi:hypothetical protein